MSVMDDILTEYNNIDNLNDRYTFITEHPAEFELSDKQIAVFDSGVGGISVLRELVNVMPNENFIYFGDSKNAPYGTKSTEEVRDLTIAKVEEFMRIPVKGCVIACNSATSAAVRVLREMYPTLPLVGIEPALKPAALYKRSPRVLVLATPMTIKEDKFKFLFERYEDKATIYKLPCPGLMEYVEGGKSNSTEVKNFLEKLLAPYREGKIDAVVLGCTHYPFVQSTIRKIMGPGVAIFDGGEGTAREMKRRIAEKGLLTNRQTKGQIVLKSSDNSPPKIKLMEHLLTVDVYQ